MNTTRSSPITMASAINKFPLKTKMAKMFKARRVKLSGTKFQMSSNGREKNLPKMKITLRMSLIGFQTNKVTGK